MDDVTIRARSGISGDSHTEHDGSASQGTGKGPSTSSAALPVRSEVLACYDHYLAERRACGPAEACDFVLVNLGHEPFGVAMTTGTVRQWLAALSKTAGLDRAVRPHMFRHATASELVGRGVGLDVVRELLGHASVRSTEVYVHPDPDALRSAVDRLGPLRVGPVVGEQR